MKSIYSLLLVMCLLSSNSWAGFGGSRGGGSFSSRSYSSSARSSGSSFGGYRSTPNAPIIRSAPRVVERTTVIHGYSGNGLLTGMLIGHALSNPGVQQPAVVYVNPGQTVAPGDTQATVTQTTPIVQVTPAESSTHWLYWVLLVLIVVGAIVFFMKAAGDL